MAEGRKEGTNKWKSINDDDFVSEHVEFEMTLDVQIILGLQYLWDGNQDWR